MLLRIASKSAPVSERPGYVTTLRLTQTGDQVQAVVEELSHPPLRARAPFDFALTPQDHENLRWYLKDSLQHTFEPAPTIAARIEARMAEIGQTHNQTPRDINSESGEWWIPDTGHRFVGSTLKRSAKGRYVGVCAERNRVRVGS